MDAIETQTIINNAFRDPRNFPWIGWILGGAFAALAAFFGAYLRRKGENLASKQDVLELTERVEQVRSQHSERLENLAQDNRKVLESMGREHQLRLAAIDRRFEAHQQAYALCQKLFSALHTERISSVVIECQNWWDNNCLYLDPEAREAFFHALRAAQVHASLLQGLSVDKSPERFEKIEKNWAKIGSALGSIEKAVALPPIKESTTPDKSAFGLRPQSD